MGDQPRKLVAGEAVAYESSVYLELSSDDDIWTLVIGKRLAYLPNEARQRERSLSNAEIEALFLHIAGHPSEGDYGWEQSSRPKEYLFAQVVH